MNRYRRYTFTTSNHASRRTIEVEIITNDMERSTHELTPASYNRFANLLNSGVYHGGLLSADAGIAWELVRF